jgi:hypothetical protein
MPALRGADLQVCKAGIPAGAPRALMVLAVFLSFCAGCLAPQAASAADAAPAQIRIPVWTDTNGSGAAVPDFHATISGSPSRILALKSPGDDLLLMVVLDMTQDLTQSTLAKDALAAEIQKLPPKTTVSVMRAQDRLKVLADPTSDRAKATDAIRSLKISGKAGLLDTMEFLGRAGDAILRKSPVRVAILYVTDSDIQNYRENFTNPVVNSSDTRDLSRKFPEALIQERITKLTTRLARQQTPVFIVHLVYRSDQLNEAYQSGLKQLAETTAGTSLYCRSGAEVADAIQKSFATITNHYSLTLALPPRAAKSAQVQITGSGANGPKVTGCRTQVVCGGSALRR